MMLHILIVSFSLQWNNKLHLQLNGFVNMDFYTYYTVMEKMVYTPSTYAQEGSQKVLKAPECIKQSFQYQWKN